MCMYTDSKLNTVLPNEAMEGKFMLCAKKCGCSKVLCALGGSVSLYNFEKQVDSV